MPMGGTQRRYQRGSAPISTRLPAKYQLGRHTTRPIQSDNMSEVPNVRCTTGSASAMKSTSNVITAFLQDDVLISTFLQPLWCTGQY